MGGDAARQVGLYGTPATLQTTQKHDKRPGNTNGLQKGPRPRKMLAKGRNPVGPRPGQTTYALPARFALRETQSSDQRSKDRLGDKPTRR
jgi:hypothetical protein